MTTEGLQLASRFSLSPNALGYCGRDSAPNKLLSCVLGGNCEGVTKELENFIVLNPYLKTLAEITGQDKFSYPVVESYWLGNDELKKTRPSDYDLLLKNFAEQKVPDWLVKELRLRRPKVFIPFHLFQILHVGVGRISGSVPFTIETINDCMIRWGNVLEIDKTKGKLKASVATLEQQNKTGYRLIITDGTFDYSPDFVPGLNVGDPVAFHWQMAAKKLTSREEVNLACWTEAIVGDLT